MGTVAGRASVSSRGYQVLQAFACSGLPLPPEEIHAGLPDVQAATEYEQVEYRAATPPCSSCHVAIDPYGLALYSYDQVGRYRTVDPEGRELIQFVPLSDGSDVDSIQDIAEHLIEGGAFVHCIALRMLDYALAEPDRNTSAEDCLMRDILNDYDKTTQTYEHLLTEIAGSRAFRERRAGGKP
jgi:hypothetical protein